MTHPVAKKRRVVLTGACGTVAGRMLDELRERYDLVLLDVKTTDRQGRELPGVQAVDLCDPDRDAYRAHFRGAEAVVHLAYAPGGGTGWFDSRFENELVNVVIAHNVYQVSLEEGVRRAVVASSNHAADWYERLWARGECELVTPEMVALSDNFYGWAKATYEHLGFLYASRQQEGRRLEVVQLRIGGPRETDLEECEPGEMAKVRRGLAVYLSQRDQLQLFVRALEVEDIRDEHGVPFQIVYGISGNSTAFWSLENARRVLGYEPEDDSLLRFADALAEHVRHARPTVTPDC